MLLFYTRVLIWNASWYPRRVASNKNECEIARIKCEEIRKQKVKEWRVCYKCWAKIQNIPSKFDKNSI